MGWRSQIVDFLDITMNLSNLKFYPYRKPDDQPVYVNKLSNHPPSIIKQLPLAISQRISNISSDERVFNEATPLYNQALKASGYSEELKYVDKKDKTSQKKKARKRNIIWFNPPLLESSENQYWEVLLTSHK